MTALLIFLSFLLIQRFAELAVAKRHENILKKAGATEVDRKGYSFIVAMHAAFFVALPLETILMKRTPSSLWIVFLAAFAAAQFLRYWAISSLGVYWNTRIIVAPNHPTINKGPYRFLRHPNYVAVITELAVIPLIFSCYITAIVFTILNSILLRRRIRIERRALGIAHSGVGEIKKPDGITT